MSGTFATIFSFEKSRKWIIREGLNGISVHGLRGADGQRLEEVSGVAQFGSLVGNRYASGARTHGSLGFGALD